MCVRTSLLHKHIVMCAVLVVSVTVHVTCHYTMTCCQYISHHMYNQDTVTGLLNCTLIVCLELCIFAVRCKIPSYEACIFVRNIFLSAFSLLATARKFSNEI